MLKILTTRGNPPIVDVSRGTESCTTVRFGQKHAELSTRRIRVHDRALVQGPVVCAGVPVVVAPVHGDTRQVRERML